MPYQRCPICYQPGRLLDVARSNPFGTSVDYYRCDPCAHVWWLRKFDPKAALKVTKPKGETPKAEQ